MRYHDWYAWAQRNVFAIGLGKWYNVTLGSFLWVVCSDYSLRFPSTIYEASMVLSTELPAPGDVFLFSLSAFFAMLRHLRSRTRMMPLAIFFAEWLIELQERFQNSSSLRVSEHDHPLTVKAKDMGNENIVLKFFCFERASVSSTT